MHFGSSISARGLAGVHRPAMPVRRSRQPLELVHRAHPERAACESFIAARFKRAYGAHVVHFSSHLLGVRNAPGSWCAASGYTPADGAQLFVEQYLDAPIEEALSRSRGHRIARDAIVEVGNLAAASAGMARTLIPLLARHLHRLGYEWVVFTLTRELRNTFARLGLRPFAIADADSTRLPDGGAAWGSYYAYDPVVMAGRISHGIRITLPQ